MNYLGTSIKNNNKYIKFVVFLLFLGCLIGFVLYHSIDNTLVHDEIVNISSYITQNNINFFFIHLLFISLLIISSFTLIGIILFPLYLVFESISIIYNILSFISVYKFRGFIYSLLYNLFSKGLFLLLVILIFKIILDSLNLVITRLKHKNLQENKANLFRNVKKVIFYFLLILINDFLIYLFLNDILAKFIFIIN